MGGLLGVDVLAHAQPGDVPGPLTPLRLLTGWTLEPLLLAVVILAGLGYAYGVRRLRQRGDGWPVGRAIAFAAGLAAIIVATQSALATYDTVLLSVHMVQHMVLSMIAPVLLALGAPVTLALRCLPQRPRRWLLSVLHSRAAAVLTFAPVALGLFIVSPWALYFTDWYDATLRSALLHDLLHLHLLVVGCLFFWPLLSRDPVPGRLSYPFRLLVVFATLPFHAFLGVTVMSMNTVLAGDWYSSLHRHWGASPAADQYLAGSLLWVSGDVVGSAIFAVLFVQWLRESRREAAREDRRLDRLEAAGSGRPSRR